MKAKLKELLKSFLKNVLGIQIHKVKNIPAQKAKPGMKLKYVHDPAFSYMIDQEYKNRLSKELASIADGSNINSYLSSNTNTSSEEIVKEFFSIYSSRELTDNTHGSGFHNAFWLYYITKILDPELIVESGVWKGHISWLLSQACPNANKFGFDISLNKLEYTNLDVQMYQQDWQSFEFPSFNPERSLIFFDCHVNHAQRLIEAKAKGFKHILFDDNPPIHKIFSHVPGIPTAAMLYAGEGIDQNEISWVWNGKPYTEHIDPDEAHQAKELIKVHYTLPDVGGPTRYGGFTFLSYVQIRLCFPI